MVGQVVHCPRTSDWRTSGAWNSARTQCALIWRWQQFLNEGYFLSNFRKGGPGSFPYSRVCIAAYPTYSVSAYFICIHQQLYLGSTECWALDIHRDTKHSQLLSLWSPWPAGEGKWFNSELHDTTSMRVGRRALHPDLGAQGISCGGSIKGRGGTEGWVLALKEI